MTRTMRALVAAAAATTMLLTTAPSAAATTGLLPSVGYWTSAADATNHMVVTRPLGGVYELTLTTAEYTCRYPVPDFSVDPQLGSAQGTPAPGTCSSGDQSPPNTTVTWTATGRLRLGLNGLYRPASLSVCTIVEQTCVTLSGAIGIGVR